MHEQGNELAAQARRDRQSQLDVYGLNSSKEDPQVSLYEVALLIDVLSLLMEMGIQRRENCLQFQAGVLAIAVGRCLPRGEKCAENCQSKLAVI